MRFTGFRKFCEDTEDVLARSLNIKLPNTDKAISDNFVPISRVQLKGTEYEHLIEKFKMEDDKEIKLFRAIEENENKVRIEDISGECDKDLLNRGTNGPEPFANRDNVNAPCSVTNGEKFWISKSAWHFMRHSNPPGGQAGGGMGGMTPPPMGGGGMPPMPPPSSPPLPGGASIPTTPPTPGGPPK